MGIGGISGLGFGVSGYAAYQATAALGPVTRADNTGATGAVPGAIKNPASLCRKHPAENLLRQNARPVRNGNIRMVLTRQMYPLRRLPTFLQVLPERQSEPMSSSTYPMPIKRQVRTMERFWPAMLR